MEIANKQQYDLDGVIFLLNKQTIRRFEALFSYFLRSALEALDATSLTFHPSHQFLPQVIAESSSFPLPLSPPGTF